MTISITFINAAAGTEATTTEYTAPVTLRTVLNDHVDSVNGLSVKVGGNRVDAASYDTFEITNDAVVRVIQTTVKGA